MVINIIYSHEGHFEKYHNILKQKILQLQVEMRLELTLFWYNPSCFIM